jgi:hypothetical protein
LRVCDTFHEPAHGFWDAQVRRAWGIVVADAMAVAGSTIPFRHTMIASDFRLIFIHVCLTVNR